MGSSLNSAMKSHEESGNKMISNEKLVVETKSEETQQIRPISKVDIFKNETVTENTYQNTAVQKHSNKVKNKEENSKLSIKKCDKSSEDLKILSNQLHKFLRHVWKAQEFSYYLFDLPCQLQNKLEADAKELESIYLQIKATSKNIETIKVQHKAIQNEKHGMKEILLKKTEEETQEMEMIVSIYDKIMYNRWEAVKSCQSETVVENFLVDVEGKLQAIKHLQTLACGKLFKMRNKTQEKKKENNLNKKDKGNNGARGETKKNKGLRRYERVHFLPDDQVWDTAINSEHPSTASFYSSHTSSIDSFLESHSDDTLNAALHIEMNSVLQALFGEQIPLNATTLRNTDVVDVD